MLKQRVITAVALLIGLLSVLFLLPQAAWLGVVVFVCAAAAWEWGGLAGFTSACRAIYAFGTGFLCLLAGVMGGIGGGGVSPEPSLGIAYAASAVFWIGVAPLWLWRHWKIGHAVSAIVVGWLVLVPAALALAHLRMIGPWVLLGAMALVWVADISAYFSGRAFGRRKLAPAISPAKTWEGAVGAMLGVVIGGLLIAQFLIPSDQPIPPLLAVVAALVAFTAASIEGDLFESLLKRQAGVKDSSGLLPGHGGILDRIDSLTSTLPLAGLLVLWLVH